MMTNSVVKILSFALFSKLAQAQIIDAKQAAKLSCYLISDWTIFDLRALEKSDGDYTSENLIFNFCQFVEWPQGQVIKKADTFAYVFNETN